MERFPLIAFFCVVCSPGNLCRAAEGGAEPARVLTRRGEVIVGTLHLKVVPIRTSYGLLEVPIEDVLRIDFAHVVTNEDRARLRELVAGLDHAQDDDGREEIRSRLVRAGALALSELREEEQSARGTLRDTLREVIEEIQEHKTVKSRAVDTVVAKRFTIRGKLLVDEARLRSAYGDLRVNRVDIDRIAFGKSLWRDVSDSILIIKTWTDADQEYLHVRNCIEKQTRLRVVEFTGGTAAEIRRAVRRHSVIVIPELEKQGNAEQVASEASKSFLRFVREGGVVISCGGSGNTKFLTASKLLPCSSESGRSGATIQRRHSIVRGVSKSIPYANATIAIKVRSGAKMKALATSSSGAILVGVSRIGAGAVVYCGWDFYESMDSHRKVLANAVRWGAGQIDQFRDASWK